MTVGESLTEARCQAGLSVDELSERTRIRGTVIRAIERDDYEACGGDLYVRGYVRAIAGAVGVEAQPLIRAYELSRADEASGAAATGDPGATALDLPLVPPVAPAAPVPAAPDARIAPDAPDAASPAEPGHREDCTDPEVTRFDLPPVTEDLAATRFDLPPVREPAGEDLMAAGYELAPGGALSRGAARGARPRPSRGGRLMLTGIAGVLLLAAGGAMGVHLASGAGRSPAAASATRGATASPGPVSATPVTSDSSAGAATSPAPRASAALPVTALPITAAEAFGPDGLADGDNPQIAKWAIDRDTTLPWMTQWYATAEFGLLKKGTGLLLDLGDRVTVTSVRIDLASYQGVNLQLRAGDGTAPGDLRKVAAARDTGGEIRLKLRHPASARYLLIWFTLLPPNGSGHYQESVYQVRVKGRH